MERQQTSKYAGKCTDNKREINHLHQQDLCFCIAAFDSKDGTFSSAEEAEQYHLAKRKMLGNIKFIGECTTFFTCVIPSSMGLPMNGHNVSALENSVECKNRACRHGNCLRIKFSSYLKRNHESSKDNTTLRKIDLLWKLKLTQIRKSSISIHAQLDEIV